MKDYLKPVFTLVKDENPEGDYRRIDAYEVFGSEEEEPVKAKIDYNRRQGLNSLLKEKDDVEDLKDAEVDEINISYYLDVEDVLAYEERLRSWGLDRHQGREERDGEDSLDRVYRAEFFDQDGTWESVTRWVGTIPDEPVFEDVFREIEGQARQSILDEDSHSGR